MTDQVAESHGNSESPTRRLLEAEHRAAAAWRQIEADGSSYGNHPLSHLVDSNETDTTHS